MSLLLVGVALPMGLLERTAQALKLGRCCVSSTADAVMVVVGANLMVAMVVTVHEGHRDGGGNQNAKRQGGRKAGFQDRHV